MNNLSIDFQNALVRIESPDGPVEHAFDTPEAFRAVSDAWLRVGWDVKYVYGFTWLGRPIIQLPDDLMRLQEVIFATQPDVIIETGVAHGGGLVFYASLCKAMGKGRVIGVDIEIRPHNREALEGHFLFPFITLLEGDSVDPVMVDAVRSHISPGDTVLVILDSCHTRDHVRKELEAYGPLVTRGSYLVATDGIMRKVAGGPRAQPDWATNNPEAAALEFAAAHDEFTIVEPSFPFNEGVVTERVTYWPNAFIQRTS